MLRGDLKFWIILLYVSGSEFLKMKKSIESVLSIRALQCMNSDLIGLPYESSEKSKKKLQAFKHSSFFNVKLCLEYIVYSIVLKYRSNISNY